MVRVGAHHADSFLVVRLRPYLRRRPDPRTTRERKSREELFSSAIAAEKIFQETGRALRRLVNFGMSQRRSAHASASPTRRFAADAQHSRTRWRQRSPAEIILRASNDSRRSRAYCAVALRRTRWSRPAVCRTTSLKNLCAARGAPKTSATTSKPLTRSFTYLDGS